MSKLSETERAQHQSNDEWLEEYNGDDEVKDTLTSQVIALRTDVPRNKTNESYETLNSDSISSIRMIDDKLLIKLYKPLTDELDNWIKLNINKLAEMATPDTGETLFEYSCYRTFFNKMPYLALTLKEIHTNAIAERYFNIKLMKKKDGKGFKTGDNCEFRIVGNTKRLQEGMFLKSWMDAVKEIPDNRPSHIYRYMNSKLKNVVFSCSDPVPHHGIIKLTKLKYEGHLYKIT